MHGREILKSALHTLMGVAGMGTGRLRSCMQELFFASGMKLTLSVDTRTRRTVTSSGTLRVGRWALGLVPLLHSHAFTCSLDISSHDSHPLYHNFVVAQLFTEVVTTYMRGQASL